MARHRLPDSVAVLLAIAGCDPGPGDDDARPGSAPVHVSGGASISAGFDFTCVLDSAGAVRCFGSEAGRVANVPRGSFVHLESGFFTSCALTEDGATTCWGDITEPPPGGPFVDLAVGEAHVCGLDALGRISCGGSNEPYAQATAPDEDGFVGIDAFTNTTCATRRDGSATCFGYDGAGFFSNSFGSFKTLDVGFLHACGLTPDDGMTCFGWNGHGQAQIVDSPFIAVSTGGVHTCAIADDRSPICFGAGETTADCTDPSWECGQSALPRGAYVELTAGWSHTCGVLESRDIVCAGTVSAPPP